MFAVLSKLVAALISPLGTAILLGMTGWLLARRGRTRLGGMLGGAALAWLWIGSMPWTAGWLTASLERDYPSVAIERLPAAGAIVVLGGAIRSPDGSQGYPALTRASNRLWHAARLYRAGKAPLLVLSGGYDPSLGDRPEADAMREFLVALGVPASAMLLESTSRTTRENARFTAVLLGQRGIHNVLLVTSASHMARARRCFEAEGLHVVAAATDHAGRPVTGWARVVPDAGALQDVARALKEWVGRLAVPFG